MSHVKQEAIAQNAFITSEFKQAALWHNNVKFVRSSKNDIATESLMKKKSEAIQQNCARLGKLIQEQLQKKQQLHNKMVCDVPSDRSLNL
jgi:hypothetical protein